MPWLNLLIFIIRAQSTNQFVCIHHLHATPEPLPLFKFKAKNINMPTSLSPIHPWFPSPETETFFCFTIKEKKSVSKMRKSEDTAHYCRGYANSQCDTFMLPTAQENLFTMLQTKHSKYNLTKLKERIWSNSIFVNLWATCIGSKGFKRHK